MKRSVIQRHDLFQWPEVAKTGGNEATRMFRIDLIAVDGTNRLAYWTLVNARPIKFTGPLLTNNAIDIAIEGLLPGVEGAELA